MGMPVYSYAAAFVLSHLLGATPPANSDGAPTKEQVIAAIRTRRSAMLKELPACYRVVSDELVLVRGTDAAATPNLRTLQTVRVAFGADEAGSLGVAEWDDRADGPFQPQWSRVFCAEADVDVQWDSMGVTVSNGPPIPFFDSAADVLGVPFASLFQLPNLEECLAGLDNLTCLVRPGSPATIRGSWGPIGHPAELLANGVVEPWQPAVLHYQFDDSWIEIRANWTAGEVLPSGWTRMSTSVFSPTLTRFCYSRQPGVALTTHPSAVLRRASSGAARLDDRRAETSLIFSQGSAWVLDVGGKVLRRPSDVRSIPWELPEIIGDSGEFTVPASSELSHPEVTSPRKTNPRTAALGGRTRLSVTVEDYDVPPVERSFVIEVVNESAVPVHIASVKASCGCIKPAISRTDLGPGETTTLTGNILISSTKPKQETVYLISDSGAPTAICVDVDVHATCRTILATPTVQLGTTARSSLVLVARTEGPSPPSLPTLEPSRGLRLGDIGAWRKILAGPGGSTVWWLAVPIRADAEIGNGGQVRVLAAGLLAMCRVVPSWESAR